MDSADEDVSPPAKKKKTMNPVACKVNGQVNRVFASRYYSKNAVDSMKSEGWVPTLQVDIPEINYCDLSDGYVSD